MLRLLGISAKELPWGLGALFFQYPKTKSRPTRTANYNMGPQRPLGPLPVNYSTGPQKPLGPLPVNYSTGPLKPLGPHPVNYSTSPPRPLGPLPVN